MKTNKRSKVPEINITPLLDVLLVLLIVFMVVSPSLHNSVNIKLPSIKYSNEKPQDQNNFIEIVIARTGITINEKPVNLDQLRKTLLEYQDKSFSIVISSDKGLDYETVFGVVDLVKDAGFEGVSLTGLNL
jgi:biopolymer transport protein ExbD